jgi:AbrB family looped-hinge helix DNA binding protein
MEPKEIYRTRLRAKGQITVPNEVRERLGITEGDDLAFYLNEEGQIIVDQLRMIPPDQAWFWTERWQRMEREAQADIEAGRVEEFETAAEAIEFLHKVTTNQAEQHAED